MDFWRRSIPGCCQRCCRLVYTACLYFTFMSQGHLDLQGLEIVGHVSLGLAAHPLARPLLEAIELLVDVHLGLKMSEMGQRWESQVFRIKERSPASGP